MPLAAWEKVCCPATVNQKPNCKSSKSLRITKIINHQVCKWLKILLLACLEQVYFPNYLGWCWSLTLLSSSFNHQPDFTLASKHVSSCDKPLHSNRWWSTRRSLALPAGRGPLFDIWWVILKVRQVVAVGHIAATEFHHAWPCTSILFVLKEESYSCPGVDSFESVAPNSAAVNILGMKLSATWRLCKTCA